MNRSHANERGLTLLELTVVVVLATLVMVGMVGFYLNSQATWVEASGQAITQREGTFILERITKNTRPGASATASTTPPSVTILDGAGLALAQYRLDPTDSLIHEMIATTPGTLVERGAIGNSTCIRFDLSANDSVVTISALHLRTSNGEVVEFSNAVGLYNQ
jgi:Tfp pilus assembly protein PilW